MSKRLIASLLVFAPFAVGCAGQDDINPVADYFPGGKADSSRVDTILDFEWDGSLEVEGETGDPHYLFESQLYYTIGQLNGSNAVGRMDRAQLSNPKTEALSNGRTRVTYHAKMPVAWGSKTNLPDHYTFKLPRLIDDFAKFTDTYKAKCTESTDEPIDTSSMWYYYRPDQSGCKLSTTDIVKESVKVTVSSANTTGKYPEYQKVWEDNTLRVVAIFGKFEKGDTDSSDAGIRAYNTFVGRIQDALSQYSPSSTPAQVNAAPGVDQPEVEFTAQLPDGKQVVVDALLVDEVSSATPDFYKRYAELSTRADFIAYNGHAGLGANIRTLAHQGQFVAGQYVILFMNGCDTYTYVDESLADTRAAINSDDPSGTKYMDYLLNAMPAYFVSDAGASMAVINGLLDYAHPITYEQIFENIDPDQEVLVSGEQDNVFQPGMAIGNN